MKKYESGRVVIVGAGIVGLMTALEIQRSGRDVLVVDPGEPGGRHAASYGNAGWISNSGVVPISVPGLWRKVPGYLLDKSGPFVIRWRYFPRLIPWLVRFIWAGRSWKRLEREVTSRLDLVRSCVEDHQRVAAEVGVNDLIVQKGQLRLYRTKADYIASPQQWEMRRKHKLKFIELEGDALRSIEPNISDAYQFGVFLEGGAHVTNLTAYQQAIAQAIQKRGGLFIRGRVVHVGMESKRLSHVVLESGSTLECTQVVLTAGIGSKELAAAAGDSVPLESERGYHVLIANSESMLNRPIMLVDAAIAITPMDSGIRLAGQVELSRPDTPPDWRRADILTHFVPKVFRTPPGPVLDKWVGERPSIADGFPCIGPASNCEGLFYGFGHGHGGLTQSTATAHVLAALIAGKEPPFDISRMSPQRF